MDINNWTGSGNLGRDPETKYTDGGKAVCNFSMAVAEGYGDKKKTIWLNVVCFGKTAEFVQSYITKGTRVGIVGRISMDQWEDKETGAKREKVKIVANQVESLQSRPRESAAAVGGESIPDDDSIPF